MTFSLSATKDVATGNKKKRRGADGADDRTTRRTAATGAVRLFLAGAAAALARAALAGAAIASLAGLTAAPQAAFAQATAPVEPSDISSIPGIRLAPTTEEDRKTPVIGDLRNLNPVEPSLADTITSKQPPRLISVPEETLQKINDSYPFIGAVPLGLQDFLQEESQKQADVYTGADWLTSLIANESIHNPEIKESVLFFAKAIQNDDIGLYRSLLSYMLEQHSLVQILSVFHIQTEEGTLLHLAAQSPSENIAYELQALLAAFLPVEERRQDNLLKNMRESVSEVSKAAPESLWAQDLKEIAQKRGGVFSLSASPFAEAIRNRDARAFQKVLQQEMTEPGNSGAARAFLLGQTEEEVSPLDQRLTRNGFSDKEKELFNKEISVVSRWLTLPLFKKDPAGRTPLEIAEQSFREGGSAVGFIALARAEQVLGTGGPTNKQGKSDSRKAGVSLAKAAFGGAVLGGAATACYMAFAD